MDGAAAIEAQQWIPYGRWIADRLRHNRSRTAVLTADRAYTYLELEQRVSQVVHALRSLGLEPGAGIALLGLNTFDYLALLLACPVAGIRYAPLHAMASASEHADIIADGDLSAVVVDVATAEATARYVEDYLPDVQLLTMGPADVGTDIGKLADTFTPEPLATQRNPDGIVTLMYTGGTTGRSKGVVFGDNVMLSMAYMGVVAWELPRIPRMLVGVPLSHSGICATLATMQLGGLVILRPRFEAEVFLDAVEQQRANCTWIVPTSLYALLDSPTFDARDLSSMETLVYGGAPISPGRLREALQRFGPILAQNYGQTETVSLTSMSKSEHDLANPDRLTSCGRPLLGVDIRIIDPSGAEVPYGEAGEICARTPGAMSGYWKRPEDEAKTVVDGWIHTGDVGRFDEDGFLHIMDRSKDMIVSGGFNVYPRSVEDALNQHPAVLNCAVFGIPHEKWGEAVTAVVVLRPGAEATQAELQAHVREARGRHTVPKSIEFRDALPLTPIGKVDKKVLKDPYWQGQTRSVG
jgi:fatty-acyl-CoA synthase